MSRRDAASEAQVRASDPESNVWLSANAGSGKTRVLTDRVARLLVSGVPPQNILCLTFTTAAATEMQNRLFGRLGEWAMEDDAKLANSLQELDAWQDRPDFLPRARRLFAQAIDTPGGLKIQTIHAFCASILRRFPLEAGISPQFQELDESAAKQLRADALDELCLGPDADLFDAVAEFLSDDGADKLTAEIVKHADAFLPKRAPDDILSPLNIDQTTSDADILAKAFDGSEQVLQQEVARIAQNETLNATLQKFVDTICAADLSNPGMAELDAVAKALLRSGGDSKSNNFPSSATKGVKAAFAPILQALHNWMDRVELAVDLKKRLYSGEKQLKLHKFAARYVTLLNRIKAVRAVLDFDDLILKTRALLDQSDASDWVRFKLDGHIDHILIDEAQDTSPAQWDVIERLARELTVGQGARENVGRTLFVVGDKKQSIYSFQGADAREFDRMETHFSARFDDAQKNLQSLGLAHSFRSARSVLDLVDHTFDQCPDNGLGGAARHLTFKTEMPGRVDLWPLVPKAEAMERSPWNVPDIPTRDEKSISVLARHIASEMKAMIGTELVPEEIENTGKFQMRKVRPGDFLVLVRSRTSGVFEEVIAACKAEGLEIAGADRLKLRNELVVRDLLALLSFLALPEDSLSLASALRSPLFGWSLQNLHSLAQGRREEHLWHTLRNREAEFPQTVQILRDLRNASDYLRPLDLLERILIRHRGRQNILARLGPETEDGIDSLLHQAETYEQSAVPSLTGFLSWMEGGEVEIKRRFDDSSNQIRVMTVHGSKGLEAPIVVLPETMSVPPDVKELFLKTPKGVFWKSNKDVRSKPEAALIDATLDEHGKEVDRLLYVAMTRAEKWLIVAGAEPGRKVKDSWYDTIRDGMVSAKARAHDFNLGPGLRLENGTWTGPLADHSTSESPAISLPKWTSDRPPKSPEKSALVSPSDLGGAKGLMAEPVTGDEDMMRRGRLIHLLLEHLPSHAAKDREHVAQLLISNAPEPIDDDEARIVTSHALKVLDAPDLQFLFTDDSLAEVGITASLSELDGRRIYGVIDRLVIDESRALIVDFKSNAEIPATDLETPEGFLRQLGAYAAAARRIYPEHEIETAILWTAKPVLMRLSHEAVSAALNRAELP